MQKYLFIVIGCGGIGGNLIRDLPKLILNQNQKMIIVDGDSVEKKNCVRQPFQEQDIGLNKARVLARKINSFYPVECLYLDKYISGKEIDVLIRNNGNDRIPYLIGCVDNDSTRKLIEEAFDRLSDAVLLDGANGQYEGNIYCAYRKNGQQFGKKRSDVYPLKKDFNPGTAGCEDRVARGETQYLITNNKVAAVMLEYIYAALIHPFAEKDYPKGGSKIERFETIYF